MKRLAACLFLAGILPLSLAQDTPAADESLQTKASIEGRVVDSATGDPVGKVTLMLTGPAAGLLPLTGETDDDGRFRFEDLNAGSYALLAQRSGYAQQTYGGRGSALLSASLTVSEGQALTGVEFRLVPHAVIAGSVLDEDGEPLTNIQVMALQTAYQRGKRQYVPTSSAQVNDIGEYRLAGLGPGRYYLGAVYRNMAAMVSGSGSPPPDENPELAYTVSYYPRATDLTGASPIDLPAGSELRSMDIWMTRTETVRVSGKIEGLGETATAIATLSRKGSGVTGLATGNMTLVRPPGASFEFRGVTPGSYVLSAIARLDFGSSGAALPVEVSDLHISGLVLNLGAGLTLEGAVSIEDSEGAAPLNGMQVVLEPVEISGINVSRATVGEDGRFSIENVNPDTYEVRLIGGPLAAYIKSIKSGSQDVTETELNLTTGAPEALAVTLSLAGAHVDGVILDDDGEPMPGAAVALIPDSERYVLYKNVATDQNGRFDFQGITPGDYKLLAWDRIDPGAFMDPEFVRPFAGKAESLSLEENDHRTISFEAIRVEP